MSLFGDIMNIQTPPEIEDPEHMSYNQRILYKEGHRDARHEAAELALTYDNLLDLVESDLQDAIDHHGLSEQTEYLIGDVIETIQKVRTGEYK